MERRQQIRRVIVVTTQNNQLIFRHIRCARNQSVHIIGFASACHVCTRCLGNSVNRSLGGNPLLGEDIDAVTGNDERLAIKISGLRVGGKIRLVLVGKPYRIYYNHLIQNRFLVNSQDFEILPVAVVVAHIPEIQIETVLGNFFQIIILDSIKTDGFYRLRIGAVNLI